MPELEGVLERITYYNEDTLFMVARLRCPGDALNTIVGNLPRFNVGEKLRLQGDWFHHPEYGRQFKVASYEVTVPHNKKGILRFLSSGLIKGVGPATAEKIVSAFGLDSLEIIEHRPDRLKEIEGIGEKKAAIISKSLRERREVMKVMSFLQGYGVSPGYAARIFRRYGDETIARVRENPYRLAEDVFGVGFRTADRIALEMGVPPESPHRVRAALLYSLNQAQEEGHVFLPRPQLSKRVMQALAMEEDSLLWQTVDKQLQHLAGEGHVVLETYYAGESVYPAFLHRAECYVASRLRELARRRLLPGNTPIIQQAGVNLSEGQRQAVQKAMETGLLVITGGPGTGKTTTIKSLLAAFCRQGLEVVLAAPTGRAAKRMTEATGTEAKTIHRLLEYVYQEGGGYRFQRDESRPLKAHAVIVDEMSMVDIILFYHLLKAIPDGCRLVCVGDMDQLPSVGPGNVLRDMITSGAVPVVRLDHIFRQAGQSAIVTNAHLVNMGQMPQVTERSRDFYFINESDPEKILAKIIDLCGQRLPRFRNRDAVNDIQVLSPMRRTLLGVDNLNQNLQQCLNPPAPHKPEVRSGSTVFRLGDKVMQVRNNYQKEVFNGDAGRIVHINREDGEVNVLYPDVGGAREVIYDFAELDELVQSYAVSVHKSQGSEYPVVVIPIVTQHYVLLQRNLLYTAITRAKELVVMLGTKKALGIAVRNNSTQERHTRLAQRLARLT